MSKDPAKCGVVEGGKRCGRPAMYKLGKRGYYERHKPDLKVALGKSAKK